MNNNVTYYETNLLTRIRNTVHAVDYLALLLVTRVHICSLIPLSLCL